MTAPSGNDTHADTPEAALVVEEALRKGKSYVTPGGLKHWPALDAFRAYRRALVADLERERARADRAEAALTKREAKVSDGSPVEWLESLRGCEWMSVERGENGRTWQVGRLAEALLEERAGVIETLAALELGDLDVAEFLVAARAALSAGSGGREPT